VLFRQETLEAAVLEGLQTHLMDETLLEVFCEEYTRQLNQLRMKESGNRDRDEARLVKIALELDRLVEAIVQGVPADRVKDRMTASDAQQSALQVLLAGQSLQAPPLLHPKMGEVYRSAVARLRGALTTSPDKAEAVEHVRALIDRIVLHPNDDEPCGFLMDIEGDLAGILSLSRNSKRAASVSGDDLVQIKVVAGTGFEPVTFRL
jgi:site-specific DNA recombinase